MHEVQYNLECDLVASNTVTNNFYEKLSVPNNKRSKKELLGKRYKKIKRLDNLLKVVDKTPHRNLPNSYKRIKKVLFDRIKLTTCAYWGGNRTAANMGNNSEVNNNENGVCNYQSKRGTQAKENVSCQFWSKWPALR